MSVEKIGYSKSFALAGVFGLGVFVAATVSGDLLPKVRAAQAPQVWEYKCDHSTNMEKLLSRVPELGQDGWEMGRVIERGCALAVADQRYDNIGDTAGLPVCVLFQTTEACLLWTKRSEGQRSKQIVGSIGLYPALTHRDRATFRCCRCICPSRRRRS